MNENKGGRRRPCGKQATFWFRSALAVSLLLGLFGPAAAPAEAAWSSAMENQVKLVIPVGRAVGIKLFSDGVMVVGFSQIPAAEGNVIPAKTCGLREGDVITHINACEVDTIEEVREQLAQIGGDEMSIRAMRNGKALQVTAHAVQCSTDGTYKLGAWLRDSMAGIGTVTYYDPSTGDFGALGHGINDIDTARLMPLETGGVLTAHVSDVKKGQRGEPGELHGTFETDRDIGTLTANTGYGIFGVLSCDEISQLEPVEVASPDQIKIGKALIYSNIAEDQVQTYEVEITRLFPHANDGRDMMIKVTDPALLEATGGIVQGMSGSPILQDGRLIGAVTHVLVSDPAQGYGIFAQRMLQTAKDCEKI